MKQIYGDSYNVTEKREDDPSDKTSLRYITEQRNMMVQNNRKLGKMLKDANTKSMSLQRQVLRLTEENRRLQQLLQQAAYKRNN